MKILVVEDNPDDLEWIRECLGHGADAQAVECVGADTLHKARTCLRFDSFDLVMLDLALPDGRGLDTLASIKPALGNSPVIVLTGLADAHVGMEAVKLGAEDYLVKDDCTAANLNRAAMYAIERHRLRGKLHAAEEELKILRGLLPICAGCKKIRDARGQWQRLESYLQAHAPVQFTHGICPDCQAEYRNMLDQEPG